MYRIADRKGNDYYNDVTLYATIEEAQTELKRAQEWAREESRREPSWKDAEFIIVEES